MASRAASLLAGMVFVGVLAGCRPAASAGAGAGAPLVFVSIQAQALMVERVGGGRVRVQSLVGPGQSAHTFEPSPKQVAKLSDAELYFAIGFPFEGALLAKIGATAPRLVVVDMSAGVRRRDVTIGEAAGEAQDADAHDHAAGASDPHVWLAPGLLTQEAANVRAALSHALPQYRAEFEHNCDAFQAELTELERELAGRLVPRRGGEFFVFHPAFGYFADAFGLTQTAIENAGKEPTARELAAVIERARAARPRLILIEPQYSRRTADELAREVGARVEIVDPYAYDVPATLRRLADLIVASGDEARR